MATIYSLLEVSENASKQEIEEAYQKMLLTYQTNPNLSDEENKDNEFILNKLKMAYEILIDDEKRKRYDNDLAKQRADNLLKNIATPSSTQSHDAARSSTTINNKAEETKTKNEIYDEEFDDDIYEETNDNLNSEDFELTKEEQKKLRKAAQADFMKNLKKAQKAEKEYNKAYNKAYNDYVKKVSFKHSKSPLKKLLIFVIIIIVAFITFKLLWIIPPTKNWLISIYEGNDVVRIIVDIIIKIIDVFKK